MKGYPAYRIEGLVFNGYISDGDIYVPIGPKESISDAIEFHILSTFGMALQTDSNVNTIRYDNAVRVGIWDT